MQSNQQNVMNQMQPGQNPPVPQQGQNPQMPQREKIWSGLLEWTEKTKAGDSKVTSQLQCSVTSTIKDGEPEV